MYIMSEDTDENYAFYSSGGFSVQQDYPNIEIHDTSISNQYQVADALQIEYSVSRINNRAVVDRVRRARVCAARRSTGRYRGRCGS